MKSELASLLGFTATTLLRLAVVVNELENRGESMGGIRMGLLPILRKIAAGEILPDAVVLYAGKPGLLKALGKMTIEKQKELVEGKITYLPEAIEATNRSKPTNQPVRYETVFSSGECRELNISQIVETASPKDIGEMAINLIMKCSNPKNAMKSFMDLAAEKNLIASKTIESETRSAELQKKAADKWVDDIVKGHRSGAAKRVFRSDL